MYSGSPIYTQGCIFSPFISHTILPSTGPSFWLVRTKCRPHDWPAKTESCCHSSSRNILHSSTTNQLKTSTSKQPTQPDTSLQSLIWLSSFLVATKMPDKNIESLLSAALAKVSSTDCVCSSSNFFFKKKRWSILLQNYSTDFVWVQTFLSFKKRWSIEIRISQKGTFSLFFTITGMS